MVIVLTMKLIKEAILEINAKLNFNLKLRKDYTRIQKEIYKKKEILEKIDLNVFTKNTRTVIKKILEGGVESRPLVMHKKFGKKDANKINVLLEIAEKFQKFQ